MDGGFEYNELEVRQIAIDDVHTGYRQLGEGNDLVFIHGFPTHSYTWRKLLPKLSQHFTCHLLDVPGLGDSQWSAKTDFNIKAQAKRIIQLLKKLSIEKLSLIAHDSGGTIARIIAIEEADAVDNLILINTEIPNHRPPFIEMYQKISRIPLVPMYIRMQLKRERFVRSAMGFKQAYTNKAMFDDRSNLSPYLDPLIQSSLKTAGAFKFLRGIDWKMIDDFKDSHKKITANVLLLWGENDKTFPIELGRKMLEQFDSRREFVSIEAASLLPHEEKPDEVAENILRFINDLV